ncbi:MAG TPA: GH3 auxin-responsive promoter family protein [Gemmataceae bacterium]|nr:GH3 auxin-responsive promoter family protein [Gemmataceae bacterium]
MRRQLRAFEEATHFPREWQEHLLQRILRHQADTGFGRDHHFAAMRNAADFRHNVPVAPYEYVEPYINRVRRGEFGALLNEPAVHMFALTSGTTATRKFIPVTQQYLADYKRGWNVWGLKAYLDHPSTKMRPIVQMSSDWQEFRTEANIPCGSVSGLTASMQKRIIRWLYCIPACVGCIKDPAAKYYVAMRLSMARDVRMIVAANPSSLVNLARCGDDNKEQLIRDLHDGTLSSHVHVPQDIRAALAGTMSKRYRRRARELEEIVRRTGRLYPRDYWPNECIIGNWMGGSVGLYLTQFPRYFSAKAAVRDIGLLASEGRMTIPIDDGTPSGVLDVTTHYFEFLPESEVDKPNPITLGAHEVQMGQTYYILPTTAYGLYRYHISDVVRVTGFYNRTPLVEFLSKGAHFANLTGEKLSEYHVTESMKDVLGGINLALSAYSVAPCWNEDLPYYGLFVERGDLPNAAEGLRLAEALDRRLREINIEYGSKRDTLRLGPIRLQLLGDQAWKRWDSQRLTRTGGTLEQYKHPCLIADPKFRETIEVEEELASVGEPAA